MDSASALMDVSGQMEIPVGVGGGGLPQSPHISSATSSPSMTGAAFAAAGFANTFVGKKILNGIQTVREIPVVRDATSTGWRNMRSWFDFCNWKRYRKPTLNKLISRDYYTGRLLRNIQYFHINYICIFLVLFVYCILTSPLLLIALFASGGAFYYAHARNSVRKIAIAGREITLFHQYCVICGLALVSFYFIGAGSTFMAVLTLSLFIMLLHAAFFGIEDDGQEFAFQLEDV